MPDQFNPSSAGPPAGTLTPAVNGTGVILHTGLGRAVLSVAARQAVADAIEGYCTLEIDARTGKRGSRHDLVSGLLCALTGAESAIVVNNNAAAVMLILHAIIFRNRGGQIQGIVTSKTNTTDIRAATIIDFTYALILMYFKEMSNIPMSTTWVFLGLLAGREIALSILLRHRPLKEAALIAGKDIGKAGIGLAVSVSLALGLPALLSRGASEPESAAVSEDTPAPLAVTIGEQDIDAIALPRSR